MCNTDVILAKKIAYFSGFRDGLRARAVCFRCRRNSRVTTIHHIVPQRYGGKSSVENMVPLCRQCHDDVEIETDNLFRTDKDHSIDELRRLLKRNFGFKNPIEPENFDGYKDS